MLPFCLSLSLLLPSSSLLGLWLLYSLVPPISPPVPSFRGRERGEIKCPEKYFNAFLSLSCQSGWRSQLHSTAVLLSFFSAISVRVAAGKRGGEIWLLPLFHPSVLSPRLLALVRCSRKRGGLRGGQKNKRTKERFLLAALRARPSLQQDCLLSLARGGEKRGTKRRRAV